MTPEAQNWFKRAHDDLDAARFNFSGAKYFVAAFLCQQAVEKALKALLIGQTGRFPRIHDLTALAKSAKAPAKIVKLCAKITPAYTAARYPDAPEEYSKEDCEKLLGYSEEVLKWTEKNLG